VHSDQNKISSQKIKERGTERERENTPFTSACSSDIPQQYIPSNSSSR